MVLKGNAQGASAKANQWHFIVDLVAVLVVAAVLSLGVWAWSSHVKVESLADCRSQATSAARSVKASTRRPGLRRSDGQVADNAVRDALKTSLDQAKTVQADAKADANGRRKAIQDLANQMQAVNDSKTAKARADQETAEQQA